MTGCSPQAYLPVPVEVGIEPDRAPSGSHQPNARGVVGVVVRAVHHEVEEP